MRINVLFILNLLLCSTLVAQPDFYKNYEFTEADTLRGMLRPERTCYDVTYYELDIKIDPKKQYISGSTAIHYTAKTDFDVLQIDLFKNMIINFIEFEGQKLRFERIYDAVFVEFPRQKAGSQKHFMVYYEGHPSIAKNPPWEAGFVWSKDKKGKDWIGVSCEGEGASLWWPNKDHLSDEPDSVTVRVAVPDPLMCVSNGNMRGKVKLDEGYTRYDWFASYPINNYNVTVNIAEYVHFSDTFTAKDQSVLPLDYYVLPYNLEKAKKQFAMVPEMLSCFEYYFDKYPFWNDGYALVETPYLGMEHQSAIAYGNKYMRGYLGSMIPRHMDWDYIIVHETGHEYWGNSISCNDLAEMWIHESFTTYMEALYVECTMGYEEALGYLAVFRKAPYIFNSEPILGPQNVNWEDWIGSDHYFKGSWILHTLRHAINNDELWFDILKSFYQKHALSNIETVDFVNYVKEKTGKDFIDSFFRQYLEYPGIPKLDYTVNQKGKGLLLSYRWINSIDEFNMPILVGKKGAYQQIQPSTEWQEVKLENIRLREFKIAEELFLIDL